mgnify:FL=1
MNLNKNLVLIGMMASGKSTIGFLLSKKLNFNFIDIDKKLEEEEGISIAQIFDKKGEEYFRNLEEKISLKALKLKKNVISLGGGGFINSNIRRIILKENISFWLNWKNSTLINRIKKNNKRPLAENLDKKGLNKLIEERRLIYKNASHKIDCENLTKSEIVETIRKIYEI